MTGKKVSIVVLLALKRKKERKVRPQPVTVTCDGSSFVVDIFFGNPLLNLELFSEEL